MLRYHDEWKLKHPTDLDFIRLIEKESGMILDWFHEYFVHTTKTIDYGITSVDAVENQTGVTQIKLERVGLMPMPLDIWVEYTDGSTEEFYIPMRIMRGEKPTEHDLKRTILEDWPWVEPSYSFTIPMPMEYIRSVSIDPTERLADINTTNNVFLLNTGQ